MTDYYAEAARLEDEGQYAEALAMTDKYIESTQLLNPDVLLIRADCLYALRMYNEALEEINEAIKIEHRLSASYVRRCMFNFKLQKWEEVVADATTAIEYGCEGYNHLACLQNRGAAYMYLDKYEEAGDDLSYAIELAPDDWVPYFDRAKLYEVTGFPEAALADLNKGIELCECAIHLVERAELYIKLERYADALTDLDKAVELDPDPEYIDLRAVARAMHANSIMS